MTDGEKIEIQKKEAFDLLVNKPVTSTFVERWFLLDEACALFEHEPQPLMLGKGLGYILDHASLPVRECDILVGRYVDRVPSDEEEERLKEIWKRRVSSRNPITSLNGGHLSFDWETLVQIGITGYIEKAEARIAEAKREHADEKTLCFLNGMLLVYQAIRRYMERYAKAAEDAGMQDCAEVCHHLCRHAPETFRQAVQLVLFVFTVYTVYAGWQTACLTLGRMDEYLLPYFLRDLSEQKLTYEEAGWIIDDLNCKANLHLGRGEHQMANAAYGGNTTGWKRNPAFDSPTYIVIGGYSNRGEEANPLTGLFAEHITPGFKNPVYIYRWNRHRPDDVFDRICDCVRQNATVLLYNDETVIPAMKHIGISDSEATDYTIHACNWPDIAGGYVALERVGMPIPEMLYRVICEERDRGRLPDSIEELYRDFAVFYREMIRSQLSLLREKYCTETPPDSGRLSMNDCFLAGPMDCGRSSLDGGVKYLSAYMLLRNVGTGADIMSALDTLVWREKTCTMEQILDAAEHNFEGYGEIYSLCRKAPKYGTDDDFADRHAVRLMNTMLDIIEEELLSNHGTRPILPLNVTITDMEHIKNGERLPATPDGRRSGAPLSENLSPTVGFQQSVTALLNSVSKLPFDRIHGGALNLRLRQETVSGEGGLVRLKALIDTYFEKGGMQVQVSVADTKILREAQKNPDQYRDLMVRITGYSAVFTDMSQNAQDEIIRRDEMA